MAKSNSFAVEIMTALEEYRDDVGEAMEKVLPEVAKEAANMVKSGAPGRTGKYASGWRSKVEQSSVVSIDAVVFNAKTPGLPHLLEFGHAKRNGGRTAAIPHIKPVEEWLKTEAAKRLQEALQ